LSAVARGLAAGLVLAGLGVTTAGRAAPMGPLTEAVAVVALEAEGADEHAAKTLTNVLRGQVLDSEEYTLGGESRPLVATAYESKCALRSLRSPYNDTTDLAFDAACLKRIGAKLGVKRYFWGYVYNEGDKAYARVHFWQEGEPDRALTLPYEPDRRLLLGERFYRKLAIPQKVGDVTLVGAARLSGELYVDGQPRGPYVPSSELTLRQGEHQVEVRNGAKVVADARVRVVVGQRSVASLAEPEAPAATAPVRPPRGPVRAAGGGPPGQDGARLAWGWATVGAGVVAIGAGVAMSLRVQSLDDDFSSDPSFVAYRRGVQAGSACDAAERGTPSRQAGAASPADVEGHCGTASATRVLQYVFYAAGATMAGFGTYLLLTPSDRAEARGKGGAAKAAWRWAPEVRPGGAGLTIGARF
jgi:hypothetical protein